MGTPQMQSLGGVNGSTNARSTKPRHMCKGEDEHIHRKNQYQTNDVQETIEFQSQSQQGLSWMEATN